MTAAIAFAAVAFFLLSGLLSWRLLEEQRQHDHTRASLSRITSRYHRARRERDHLIDQQKEPS